MWARNRSQKLAAKGTGLTTKGSGSDSESARRIETPRKRSDSGRESRTKYQAKRWERCWHIYGSVVCQCQGNYGRKVSCGSASYSIKAACLYKREGKELQFLLEA